MPLGADSSHDVRGGVRTWTSRKIRANGKPMSHPTIAGRLAMQLLGVAAVAILAGCGAHDDAAPIAGQAIGRAATAAEHASLRTEAFARADRLARSTPTTRPEPTARRRTPRSPMAARTTAAVSRPLTPRRARRAAAAAAPLASRAMRVRRRAGCSSSRSCWRGGGGGRRERRLLFPDDLAFGVRSAAASAPRRAHGAAAHTYVAAPRPTSSLALARTRRGGARTSLQSTPAAHARVPCQPMYEYSRRRAAGSARYPTLSR